MPSYGATETGCGTILQKEQVAVEGSEELVARMKSVGKAKINIDVRVVDENGNNVTKDGDHVGEVIFRGDSVIKEYWNSPELTRETIKNGWFYSGDLATMDEDGFIYLVDRKKDMIVSGGINIYPQEIEQIIYTHPAVLHTAVIGVPDEKWGETPKAVIVLKEGTKATEEEVITLCKQNLASYKKPTSVEFVDTVPLTSSGKILKRKLREQYRSKEGR